MLTSPITDSWGFSRRSISDQAASALREAIRRGDLTDPLPGEHQLARDLRISRPSVSAALARLASEGLIVIEKGRRSRIAKPSKAKARSSSVQLRVCVVCPLSRETHFLRDRPILLEMHTLFASRGISWEEVFDAKLGGARPEARLQKLVAGRRHVCWLLFAAPEQTQRWFANAGVPAIVVGSCPCDLNLPSVDLNYGAVGWHAAGSIISRGHTKSGLILPEDQFPGDVACRLEFLRYVKQQGKNISVSELSAPANPVQYRAKLDRLLIAPHRPTAIFTMRASLTMTLVTHVLASGLRIPRDISIISRDTHPLLESALPELTRYSSTTMKLAIRAFRIASNVLAGRDVAARPALVTPTFVAGSTLDVIRG